MAVLAAAHVAPLRHRAEDRAAVAFRFRQLDTPSARKMREALALLTRSAPELEVDGEMQADTALLAGRAASACSRIRRLKGEANLLIMPNLDAANIAYQIIKVHRRRAAGRPDPARRGKPGPHPDAVGHRARRRQHDGGRGGRGAGRRTRGLSGRPKCCCRAPVDVAGRGDERQHFRPHSCGKKQLARRLRCAYVAVPLSSARHGADRRHSLIREPARRSLGLRSLVGEDGMRQNALFQSGTGLGTPGTARKEDSRSPRRPAPRRPRRRDRR